MHTVYVTVYEKTRHMGFFVKVVYDIFDKLYPRARFETDRVLRFGDSELCLRSRYTHRKRESTV